MNVKVEWCSMMAQSCGRETRGRCGGQIQMNWTYPGSIELSNRTSVSEGDNQCPAEGERRKRETDLNS